MYVRMVRFSVSRSTHHRVFAFPRKRDSISEFKMHETKLKINFANPTETDSDTGGSSYKTGVGAVDVAAIFTHFLQSSLIAFFTCISMPLPLKSTNGGNIPPPKSPNLLEALLQGWQCWALRNPRNVFSRLFLPFVAWVDGFVANKSTYLDRKRR
jgi:hypothetical protein